MKVTPAYYFLGVDGAASEGQQSDDGARVIIRAPPRDVANITAARTDWWADAVYAQRLTSAERASARQWAGLIHRDHQRFRLEKIMMDPGGGGMWIKRELASPRQLLGGSEMDVTPIGDLVDAPTQMVHGHFILHLFKRRDPGVMELWPDLSGEGSQSGDDVLKDALLAETREALQTQCVRLPALVEDWQGDPARKAEMARWQEEQRSSLRNLSLLVQQARNIVVLTRADGTFDLTNRGARRFSTVGKDDLVYAWMYALLAFWVWLKMGDFGSGSDGDETGFYGWQ